MSTQHNVYTQISNRLHKFHPEEAVPYFLNSFKEILGNAECLVKRILSVINVVHVFS